LLEKKILNGNRQYPIYAGGGSNNKGSLHVSNQSSLVLPGTWLDLTSTLEYSNIGEIYSIAILNGLRRIVLATGNGI